MGTVYCGAAVVYAYLGLEATGRWSCRRQRRRFDSMDVRFCASSLDHVYFSKAGLLRSWSSPDASKTLTLSLQYPLIWI